MLIPQYSQKVVKEIAFESLTLDEIFVLFAECLEAFGYSGARDYLNAELSGEIQDKT